MKKDLFSIINNHKIKYDDSWNYKLIYTILKYNKIRRKCEIKLKEIKLKKTLK